MREAPAAIGRAPAAFAAGGRLDHVFGGYPFVEKLCDRDGLAGESELNRMLAEGLLRKAGKSDIAARSVCGAKHQIAVDPLTHQSGQGSVDGKGLSRLQMEDDDLAGMRQLDRGVGRQSGLLHIADRRILAMARGSLDRRGMRILRCSLFGHFRHP